MRFECRMSNKEFRRLKFCDDGRIYFVIRHSLFDILRFCAWTRPVLLLGDSLLDIGYSSALSRG